VSNDVVIVLRDRRVRFAEKAQLIQDVFSAFALVPAGLARLHSVDPLERWFAFVELAGVAALAVITLREMRDHDDITPGIGWVNVIVGAVLICESALQTHEGSKWFTPTLLTGLVSIGLGIFQGRLRARKQKRRERSIRITDDGIAIRLAKFRRFDQAWSNIRSIEERDGVFTISPHEGRAAKIRVRRYDNPDDIAAALRSAAEAHRIALTR
jgi:hypothetical protein